MSRRSSSDSPSSIDSSISLQTPESASPQQDTGFDVLRKIGDAFSEPAELKMSPGVRLGSINSYTPRTTISGVDHTPRFPTIEEPDGDAGFDMYIFYQHYQQLNEPILPPTPRSNIHVEASRSDFHDRRSCLIVNETDIWVKAEKHHLWQGVLTESPLEKLARLARVEIRQMPPTERFVRRAEEDGIAWPNFGPTSPESEFRLRTTPDCSRQLHLRSTPLYKTVSSPDLSDISLAIYEDDDSTTNHDISDDVFTDRGFDSYNFNLSYSKPLPLPRHRGHRLKQVRKFVREVLTSGSPNYKGSRAPYRSSIATSSWSMSTQSLDDWTTVSIPSSPMWSNL